MFKTNRNILCFELLSHSNAKAGINSQVAGIQSYTIPMRSRGVSTMYRIYSIYFGLLWNIHGYSIITFFTSQFTCYVSKNIPLLPIISTYNNSTVPPASKSRRSEVQTTACSLVAYVGSHVHISKMCNVYMSNIF